MGGKVCLLVQGRERTGQLEEGPLEQKCRASVKGKGLWGSLCVPSIHWSRLGGA